MNKFFNGRKYFLEPKSNRWYSTTDASKSLSHDVWNFYHPNDLILKGDSNAIHHKNGGSSNDRIENLQKMKCSEHNRLHATGNQNNLGKHWSDEAKQKMSDAKLGHIVTEETKQKMSKVKLGSKNSNWKGGKKK